MDAAAPPPYVVVRDPGGYVLQRARFILSLLETGRSVRIEGPCYSACTMFLVLVPARKVCITPSARLGFHWSRNRITGKTSEEVNRLVMELYPSSVRRWIVSRGGLTGKLLQMNFAEARRHVPVCSPT